MASQKSCIRRKIYNSQRKKKKNPEEWCNLFEVSKIGVVKKQKKKVSEHSL